MIEILATGAAATVQDLGRTGLTALGVPRSGAFDRAALRLANRLVGNPDGAAGLEITLGGLELRSDTEAVVAFTGAPCPGAPDWAAAVSLAAGETVRLGPPVAGLRSYLAVRGGIAVERVLGSASTDLLSGLGPPPLAAGQHLPVGPPPAQDPPLVLAGFDSGPVTLQVVLGPRDDWFTPAARQLLTATPWTVRPESDRVGVRLDGPRLDRARDGELASEATLPGAIQVPPDGRPILFGPDCPVTGGYPVIGVVDDPDRAAQLRPGDTLRFSARR